MVEFKSLRTAFKQDYPVSDPPTQTDLLVFQLIRITQGSPVVDPVETIPTSSTLRLINPTEGFQAVAGVPIELFAISTLPKTIGKVEFYQGSTKIGEDRNLPYSATFTPTVVGALALRAVGISLDGQTQVSSEIVNINVVASPTPIAPNTPPTVSLANPGTVTAGQTVTLSATASDSDGIAKVEFYQGSTKLGEDTTSPYQQSWSPTGGNYVLTAIAYDTKNAATTSTAINVTVAGSATTTTTTTPAPAFDRVFVFNTGNTGALQDGSTNLTGCTANAAQSATTQFRFSNIASRQGTPAIMQIYINNVAFLNFNYPTDYEGKPYRLVGSDGTVYPQRNITAGRVDYP